MIQRNQIMFTDTCDINAVQINMENDQLAGYVCFNALNQFFFYIFIWHPLSKKKVKKDYNAAISAKKKNDIRVKNQASSSDLFSVQVKCLWNLLVSYHALRPHYTSVKHYQPWSATPFYNISFLK